MPMCNNIYGILTYNNFPQGYTSTQFIKLNHITVSCLCFCGTSTMASAVAGPLRNLEAAKVWGFPFPRMLVRFHSTLTWWLSLLLTWERESQCSFNVHFSAGQWCWLHFSHSNWLFLLQPLRAASSLH